MHTIEATGHSACLYLDRLNIEFPEVVATTEADVCSTFLQLNPLTSLAIQQAGPMTIAEIGCGRYVLYTDLRVLTIVPHRSRQHSISSAGDEQESTS